MQKGDIILLLSTFLNFSALVSYAIDGNIYKVIYFIGATLITISLILLR